MPTVRVWNPQVEQAPLPTPRFQPADTSGFVALARGFGQVAQAAQQVSEAEQQELEKSRSARLMDAYAELAASRMDIEDTVQKQKGKDALGVDLVQQSTKLLDNHAEKIAASFNDQELTDRFKKMTIAQRLQLQEVAGRHVAQEDTVFRAQTYKSVQELATQDAARSALAGDLEGVTRAVGTKLGAVDELARTHGWSDQTHQAEANAQVTTLHTGVVQAFIDADRVGDASAYLTQYRSQIEPATFEHLSKMIRPLTYQQEAEVLARKIDAAARFEDNPTEIDTGKAFRLLDEATAGKPADFVELAQRRLEQRVRVSATASKEAFGRVAAQALVAFQAPGADGRPVYSTAAIPKRTWAWLNNPANGREAAEYAHTLLAWERDAMAHARGERLVPSDDQARNYLTLVDDMRTHPEAYRPGAMTAEQFAGTWMRSKTAGGEPPLSLRDYNVVVELFTRLREPTAPVEAKTYEPLILEQAQGKVLKGDKSTWGAREREAIRLLNQRVETFANQQRQILGRAPDPAIIRGFVDDQLKEVEVQRWFWTTTQPRITAEATGATVVSAPPPAALGVTPPPAVRPRSGGPASTRSTATMPSHAAPRTVVERRRTSSGQVIVKFSDGTFGTEAQ